MAQVLSGRKNTSHVAAWLQNARTSKITHILFCALVPAITLVTLEWIARGSLQDFGKILLRNAASFLFSYLLLVSIYVLLLFLSGRHALPIALVGLLGNVPAIVTHYKLTLRGEPFLPWDISQIGDLMAIGGKVNFDVTAGMIVTVVLFILLTVVGGFLKLNKRKNDKRWRQRLIGAAISFATAGAILFGLFLTPAGNQLLNIKEDSWMQDRYYRTYGVIAGFLTNLQLLDIQKPDTYNEGIVAEILRTISEDSTNPKLGYEDSYAAVAEKVVGQPDIIFVMAESFWDVTALEGIEYDQEILPNLTALKEEGAYGYAHSPSFGGGTCDVEFEALTGFSMEYLPAGSKPYQQYVTKDIFSLPWYLKTTGGYETVAIHGYGAKFWSRDTTYPHLGFDEFIASDDFVDPIMKRGFISDEAMVDRILEEYNARDESPLFIHAVTMQNHTGYDRTRYPSNELVRVTLAPDALDDSIISQLEDCATGIRDMDSAIGKLTDALRESDRPTIVVFWGDHLNPMSDGYSLFEETGFIEKDDTSAPELHQTPILIWSNYAYNQVELGTISTYNISPVMMDLYGLEMPEMFRYLSQQMETLHGRTKGITIHTDNTTDEILTEMQQEAFSKHEVLQYDLLFGDMYTPSYLPGSQ